MWLRLGIGVLLCVVGGVWVGQGLGFVHGSFMTGEGIWAVIGAVAIVFGASLFWGIYRQQRREREQHS